MLNVISRTGPGISKPLLDRSRHLCSLLGKAGNAGEEVIIVVNVLKIALHIDNKVPRAEVSKRRAFQ
jgi:hypothetical protein